MLWSRRNEPNLMGESVLDSRGGVAILDSKFRTTCAATIASGAFVGFFARCNYLLYPRDIPIVLERGTTTVTAGGGHDGARCAVDIEIRYAGP